MWCCDNGKHWKRILYVLLTAQSNQQRMSLTVGEIWTRSSCRPIFWRFSSKLKRLTRFFSASVLGVVGLSFSWKTEATQISKEKSLWEAFSTMSIHVNASGRPHIVVFIRINLGMWWYLAAEIADTIFFVSKYIVDLAQHSLSSKTINKVMQIKRRRVRWRKMR